MIDTDFPIESKFDVFQDRRANGVSAFLTIQEGCDKFAPSASCPTRAALSRAGPPLQSCTRRGPSASGAAPSRCSARTSTPIMATVTPADLGPRPPPARIGRDPGLGAAALHDVHPRDMDADLICAHRDLPQLMPFLHLPVHRAPMHFEAMNRATRRTTTAASWTTARRAARSGAVLGLHRRLPGRDDADFAATLRLVGDIGFAQAFSFKYSARPGTPAAVCASRCPRRQHRPACNACRLCSTSGRRIQRSQRRCDHARSLERPGRHPAS